jgi:hypothetical protein
MIVIFSIGFDRRSLLTGIRVFTWMEMRGMGNKGPSSFHILTRKMWVVCMFKISSSQLDFYKVVVGSLLP